MAPISLRRKKKAAAGNSVVDSAPKDQDPGPETPSGLPTVEEVGIQLNPSSSAADLHSLLDVPSTERPESPADMVDSQKGKGSTKLKKVNLKKPSSHRIFSSSSSKSNGSNSSAISALGESLVNTFSFTSSHTPLASTRKQSSSPDPALSTNVESTAPPIVVPPAASATSRFTSIFTLSKRPQPNSRSSTPQLLSPTLETTPRVTEDSGSTMKKSSKWKLHRKRGGSFSSLSRTSNNNNSSISLFAFGNRSQRSSVDGLHPTNSTQSTASNQNHYLSASSPASIRIIPKSSSLRSLVDLRRYKNDKTNGTDNDGYDHTKAHTSKKSSESTGIKSTISATESSNSGVNNSVHDLPTMRASSDATASTTSSSPVKVTFEIPGFMVTQPDDNIIEEPFSAKQDRSLSNGTDKKPSHSFFSSFVNLLDTSSHENAVMPRSSSTHSLQQFFLQPKPTETKPPSPSRAFAQPPLLNSTSSFKGPLLKLKKKTVSKLFFNDTLENETRELSMTPEQPSEPTTKNGLTLSIDPPSPTSITPSQASSPVSPHSLNPTPSNGEYPFPLLRTCSNQAESESFSKDFENEESGRLTPNPGPSRARSHTLSSLDQRSNSSNIFSKPSKSGFFSNRRSDSESAVGTYPSTVSSSRQSPSPRPSLTLQKIASLSLPIKEEDDTPEGYLAKVRQVGFKGYTAEALSKYDDEFHRAVLNHYLKLFSFSDDPLDMALRKFLISVRLPRETQQIDRVLEAFAFRYHECNPSIYSSAEIVYFIAFSLMILHTDFFNKNNKYKMQKADYFKITDAADVSKDILDCFYDNITYTPFIHTDEDVIVPGQLPKLAIPRRSSTFGRNSKDLTDPYSLLLEGRLDSIRPRLECLSFDDPYSYAPLESKVSFLSLRKQFEDGQSLQLISQRSRPGAFLSPDSLDDPNSSGPGVVEIKVVKAGFLSKLEGKRKNTWREWGIILTASQLYFFKDTSWFRSNIMNQQSSSLLDRYNKRADVAPVIDDSIRNSLDDENPDAPPVITRPLVDGFHPHAVVSTTDMVALLSQEDAPKNRNSFLLGYKGGTTEWFSSQNEQDLTDWILKINFAASFNTFYVVGIQGALPRRQPRKLRSLRRNNSDSSMSTMYSGNNSLTSKSERATARAQEYAEVHFARKFNVEHKLEDIKRKLKDIQDQLNVHVRTGQNLKLLAPIQPRTRDAIFMCAATLTATLRWKWLERRKLLCYQDYFEMDLDVENEICSTLKPIARPGSSLSAGQVGSFEEYEVEVTDTIDELQEEQSKITANSTHKRVVSDASTHTVRAEPNEVVETELPDTATKESVVTPTSPTHSISLSDAASFKQSVPSEFSEQLPEEDKSEFTQIKVAKRSRSQAQFHSRSKSQNISQTPLRSKSHTHLRSQSHSMPKRSDTSGSGDMGPPGKRMPLTLREPSSKKKPQQARTQTGLAQRSTSLVRKEGENITLHGKKFHVVEVNPEFAITPNHQRTLSQTLSGSTTSTVSTASKEDEKYTTTDGEPQVEVEAIRAEKDDSKETCEEQEK